MEKARNAVAKLMVMSGEQAPEVLVRVMRRLRQPDPPSQAAHFGPTADGRPWLGATSARKRDGPTPYMMQGYASSRGL